jgi:hypothetical protein
MAQAVSRRPGLAHGSVHVGFFMEKVALGQVLSEYFGFLLSILFDHGSPRSHITWVGALMAALQRRRLTPSSLTATWVRRNRSSGKF